MKSHPIEMEMSWEVPALLGPPCWSHCAYSLAQMLTNFGFLGGRIVQPPTKGSREEGGCGELMAHQASSGWRGRGCGYAWVGRDCAGVLPCLCAAPLTQIQYCLRNLSRAYGLLEDVCSVGTKVVLVSSGSSHTPAPPQVET